MRLPSLPDIEAVLADLAIPSNFLIGTAGSGYQVEGGFNGPGEPKNNWVAWESRPGNEPAGLATRFWHAPHRDFLLAQSLNLNAFRLGIEWARVQPEGPDAWDDAAIAKYVEMLRDLRAHGLEPVVTLHHFTHPAWAGDDPWLSAEMPAKFATFVEGIVGRITDGLLAQGAAPVKYWITINEPNVLASTAYMSTWQPSSGGGARPMGRTLRALDALYAAHIYAYGAIHRTAAKRGLPPPLVSFNNFAMDLYGMDCFFVDVLLSRSRGIAWGPALKRDLAERKRAWSVALAPVTEQAHEQSLFRGLFARTLHAMWALAFNPSRLPLTAAALAASDYPRPLDYLALDYYDAALANQLRLVTGLYEPWDWHVFPEGLYHVLRANAGDGLPILIAENGLATHRKVDGSPAPRADGVTRDVFLRAHVYEVLRAVKEGVPVLGYLHWSLTDNYEWGRYAPRFGLYGVDYTHPERQRLTTDASGVDAASIYGRLAHALRTNDLAALRLQLSGGT